MSEPTDLNANLANADPVIADLARDLAAGQRRALARGITLIESGRDDHRVQALELLALLSAQNRTQDQGQASIRIGLSGTPGVGKSTFIESFGMDLIRAGHRVAVLAVDPSSTRTGGSILGDKTRMELLSREANAFIRPSPSQTQLGGVARRTRDVVSLCEAAGYDVVIIETVGVGQSEITVAQMVDVFALLLAPAGGDELQGVKRGIMEVADLVLVNKADGALKPAAMRTCADYTGALHLLRPRLQDPKGFPKVLPVSALEREGLSGAWREMQALIEWRREHGHFAETRAAQGAHWFQQELRHGLLKQLETEPVKSRIAALSQKVALGEVPSAAAAEDILRGMGLPFSPK